MFNTSRFKNKVRRAVRSIKEDAVFVAGFGAGAVSGVIEKIENLVPDIPDLFGLEAKANQMVLEHMADQYDKDPDSLKGEYRTMAMTYSAMRQAKKETKK